MDEDDDRQAPDDGPPSRQVTVRPTARLLAGRYHLAEPIGAGGYGKVFSAFDERTERSVAVKLFHRCDSKALRADFLEEAQRTATVAHRCVVRVHDAGFDGSEPYLVMELLEGKTVGAQIAARGAMAGAKALTKAMEREPSDRFRNATQMREALRPLLEAARESPSVHPPSVVQPVSSSLTGPQRAVETIDLD